MKLYDVTGQTILATDKPFAKGGEGTLHRLTNDPMACAKILIPSCRSKDRINKLQAMAAMRPKDLITGNFRVTWPTGLLYDQNKKFCGFLMPLAFNGSIELDKFILKLQNQDPIWFSKYNLSASSKQTMLNRVKLCTNIAVAMHKVHFHKCVFGDMKPKNIMVTHSGCVTVVDADSFQINGFPATAMTPEFAPPEAAKKNTPNIASTWDDFSLAAVIYYVLVGLHPYTGSFRNGNGSIADNILQGFYVHGVNKNHAIAIPMLHQRALVLPTILQDFFSRAFDRGHTNPSYRPTAAEWASTLFSIVTTQVNLIQAPPATSFPVTKTIPNIPNRAPIAAKRQRKTVRALGVRQTGNQTGAVFQPVNIGAQQFVTRTQQTGALYRPKYTVKPIITYRVAPAVGIPLKVQWNSLKNRYQILKSVVSNTINQMKTALATSPIKIGRLPLILMLSALGLYILGGSDNNLTQHDKGVTTKKAEEEKKANDNNIPLYVPGPQSGWYTGSPKKKTEKHDSRNATSEVTRKIDIANLVGSYFGQVRQREKLHYVRYSINEIYSKDGHHYFRYDLNSEGRRESGSGHVDLDKMELIFSDKRTVQITINEKGVITLDYNEDKESGWTVVHV